MRSRRVIAHLERTRAALRSSTMPDGFVPRDAARADLGTCDLALLDLLTVALDTADDRDLQMLVSYARTSLILSFRR